MSEQGRSGQSVAAFCRERELCAPHFFAWKKRLREAAGPKFVEVKLVPAGWGGAGGGLAGAARDRRAALVPRAASVSRPAPATRAWKFCSRMGGACGWGLASTPSMYGRWWR